MGALRNQDYIPVAQRSQNTKGVSTVLDLLFTLQLFGDPGPLVRGQPASLRWPVSQIEDRDHTHHDRRDPLQDEQPSPTSQPKPGEAEQQTRDRGANHVGERISGIKESDGLAPVLISEPMGQIDNDARQKSRLRGAQEKTHQIKFPRRVDEGHQHSHKSPGDHDASDPTARTPSLHNQCAGDFQQEVTEEEDTCPHANHTIAESKVAGHLESGGPNVHSIQESDNVQHKQEGQKTPCDTMPGAPANLGRGRGIDILRFLGSSSVFRHWRSNAEPKHSSAWALPPPGCGRLLSESGRQ